MGTFTCFLSVHGLQRQGLPVQALGMIKSEKQITRVCCHVKA
jgi:hypothetical protein